MKKVSISLKVLLRMPLFCYLIFGVLTTILNIALYVFCYHIGGMSNVISNIAAWIAAVAFAYITNKLWVFNSKDFTFSVMRAEIWKFASCRLATGILDLIIMFVGVDLLKGPPAIYKIGSNVLVVILNYVFSKLIIFKKSIT